MCVELTSQMELFYGLSRVSFFVLVVGNGGVLKHEPVLLIRSQR